MTRNYRLTDAQANAIKDILKLIGRDDELNAKVAESVGMSENEFNAVTDNAFIALGNGRVTEA